ncbi:MAG: hypothetical protein K2I90_07005 [Odoribacter sp.]|nr:hypothetical protein [Odoribacter sp.]
MKRIVCFVVLLLGIWAFVLPEGDSLPQKVVLKLMALVQKYPQEKVYLQTDKDHYEVGENVWLRAYLTNAYTHVPSDLSRFVYVELRDRQDSLHCRLKIPFRDSVFFGFVPLSEKLVQGDYFLRAYSYWMQNAGDDFVFRKKIKVINPQSSRVQATVTWEKTDKEYVASIRLHNSRDESYDKVFVDYVQGGKSKVARTDDRGSFRIKLDTANFGKQVLLRFREGVPFDYEQSIYLPDPREDFVVSFMPEGGNLLEGCQQTVAMKAIGPDGLSRDVSGIIMDDKGEQVAYVRTIHKGMGAFDMTVEPGRRYYGLFAMNDGEQKRFDLPEAVARGIGLKLMNNADAVGYIVMAADSMPAVENLYILIHSRGVPVLCQPVRVGAKGRLQVKDLPEGILHFLLIDDKNNVYSERLSFVRKKGRPEIAVEPAKRNWFVRERVEVDMQVFADSLQVKQGSFSVAVTDDGQVEQDSLRDHILSYLLLSSDLKGHVEEPAFYFKDYRITTLRFLDLLMMTQGWSRFRVPDILQDRYEPLKYYMERGQAISGKVKNFWGKDASDANLILFSNTGIVQMVNADTSGHFVIQGITFPDSTKFMLQGRSKRGRRSVEVLVDRDEFLTPSVRIPFDVNETVKEDDFYKRFTKDYYYENGVKVYILDEAVVKRRPVRKTYSFYDNVADYFLDSTKLASMQDWDIRRILQEFPGIEAYGDSVQYFGRTVMLLVNDFEETFDNVLLIRPEDLLSISYIRPPMSVTFWGQAGANGAISITTSPNFVRKELPRPNMVNFTLLGYQKKAEFYMPRYEVDSVRMALKDTPDRRSTIYWNPVVRTNAEGRAHFSFTTSDSFGPYTVIIEGILKDGTVCRKEGKIRLKPVGL